VKQPVKIAAAAGLGLLAVASFGAGWIRPSGYAAQFRDAPAVAPCARFPLGTDELGRDLLARTLYGMRLSFLLAGSAALVSSAIAGLVGIATGVLGKAFEQALEICSNLLMSLPWIFLLLLARALLPLEMPAETSVLVTFLLLALLGWAPAARTIGASARLLRHSGFTLRARAEGAGSWRLIRYQIWPNLRSFIGAQFLILLPGFILSEATLSFLGLGVGEPLPSWGGLLRDLEDYSAVADQPWRIAPLILMFMTVACLESLSGAAPGAAQNGAHRRKI
jgi:peptide/nickel transport system permease protein